MLSAASVTYVAKDATAAAPTNGHGHLIYTSNGRSTPSHLSHSGRSNLPVTASNGFEPDSTAVNSSSLLPRVSTDSAIDAPPSEEIVRQHVAMRVLISTKEAGIVIGQSGANVADIRQQSGARVTVSDMITGAHERVLTVAGPLDAAAKAFSMVATRIAEKARQHELSPFQRGPSRAFSTSKGDDGEDNPDGSHPPSTPIERSSEIGDDTELPVGSINPVPVKGRPISLRFLVPHARMGSVIGRHGVKIKEIQEISGSRLTASEELLPNSTERVVTVTGVVDAIHIASYHLGLVLLEHPERNNGLVFYKPTPGYVHRPSLASISTNGSGSLGGTPQNETTSSTGEEARDYEPSSAPPAPSQLREAAQRRDSPQYVPPPAATAVAVPPVPTTGPVQYGMYQVPIYQTLPMRPDQVGVATAAIPGAQYYAMPPPYLAQSYPIQSAPAGPVLVHQLPSHTHVLMQPAGPPTGAYGYRPGLSPYPGMPYYSPAYPATYPYPGPAPSTGPVAVARGPYMYPANPPQRHNSFSLASPRQSHSGPRRSSSVYHHNGSAAAAPSPLGLNPHSAVESGRVYDPTGLNHAYEALRLKPDHQAHAPIPPQASGALSEDEFVRDDAPYAPPEVALPSFGGPLTSASSFADSCGRTPTLSPTASLPRTLARLTCSPNPLPDDSVRGGQQPEDSDEAAAATLDEPEPYQRHVFVPNSLVGAVIGRGGARIGEIRQASGCFIKISDYAESAPLANLKAETGLDVVELSEAPILLGDALTPPPAAAEVATTTTATTAAAGDTGEAEGGRLITVTGTPESTGIALMLLQDRLEAEKARVAAGGAR
ncbi:hypothetical protein HK405_007499, partial [Cladochytrium tenue]